MIDEFDLPADIIDRKVTKMKMISPSNREVDVGKTLSETEYIGMCRREVLDDYLRQRAKKNGAKVINSLFMKFERPQGEEGPYKCHFNNYDAGGKVGKPDSVEVSCCLTYQLSALSWCSHLRTTHQENLTFLHASCWLYRSANSSSDFKSSWSCCCPGFSMQKIRLFPTALALCLLLTGVAPEYFCFVHRLTLSSVLTVLTAELPRKSMLASMTTPLHSKSESASQMTR